MAEPEDTTSAETDAQRDENASAEPGSESEDQRAAEDLKKFSDQDELPSDPREWPDGKARFKTFGDDGEPYGEGPTEKLGPPEVVHHADGSVSVGGEKAENPDDYKGEPIPGGPTDPSSPGGPESEAAQAESNQSEGARPAPATDASARPEAG